MFLSRLSSMLDFMKTSLLLLCWVFAVTVMATDVYMTVDENGNATFTDQAVEGSKKIEVKEVITIPALKNPPPPRKTLKVEPRYTKLTITNPKQDETYFRSEGELVIGVTSAPHLRLGDLYVYRLNGEEIYAGRATIQSIAEMDRGTHTIQIAIANRDREEVMVSEPVTFHMRQASIQGR